MTRRKQSLFQIEQIMKKKFKSSEGLRLKVLEEYITSLPENKMLSASDKERHLIHDENNSNQSVGRVESKSYDEGLPVDLRYPQHHGGTVPVSKQHAIWDLSMNQFKSVGLEDESFEVEPFLPGQSIDEPVQPKVKESLSNISHKGLIHKSPEKSSVDEDLKEIKNTVSKKTTSVLDTTGLAEDFDSDINALINDAKDQNSPAVRNATSEETKPGENVDETLEQEEKKSEEPVEHPHAVFDKLGKSMQFANTFNMGSVDIDKRFNDFEREIDTLDSSSSQAGQTATTKALTEMIDLQEVDLIEDLSAIEDKVQDLGLTSGEISTSQENQATAESFSSKPGTNKGTTKSEALVVAQAFSSSTATTKAFQLNHQDVSNRLIELINQPDLIEQGSLNLCGPAAFFYFLLNRDPKMFAQYVSSLFATGQGTLGRLSITPDDDLKNQTYQSSWGSPSADWMAMSALRDDSNWLIDYEGTPQETISAATTAGDVKTWMKNTDLYTKVRNEGNWVSKKGLAHAKGLDVKKHDNALLINAHILSNAATARKKSNEYILKAFPNHWVCLKTPVTENNGEVMFDCWSWGSIYSVKLPTSTFEANYYGAVIGELAT